MFRLNKLFWLDDEVRGKDVKRRQFALYRFPLRMIVLVRASCIVGDLRHQMLVAKLITDIVGFADSIGATELELENLLGRCLIKWV